MDKKYFKSYSTFLFKPFGVLISEKIHKSALKKATMASFINILDTCMHYILVHT